MAGSVSEAQTRASAMTAVTLVSVAVLVLMNAWLVFLPTTPTGGDTGAHVLAPAFLRDSLLPALTGWSNSWFAGIPLYYFYFPLPSTVIVLLDAFLPYGVAFKMVTIAGIAALPFATYYLARSLTFGRTVAVVCAGASGAFLVMESFTILGGNIPSTLAGEFAFSWSFALALVYLGTLIRSIDDRSLLPWAGLLLGLTALAHIVTTVAIVLATLAILVARSATGRTIASWVIGFSVAAFWALPLLARLDLTANMGWIPLSGLDNVLPIEIWAVSLLAIPGAVLAWRRTPYSASVLTLTFLWPLVGYFLLPQGRVWNGRFLPFWFFGIHFFAAIAVGYGLKALARRLPRSFSTHWLRGGLVVLVLLTIGWFSGRLTPGLIPPSFPVDTTTVAGILAIGALLFGASFLLPRRTEFSQAAPFLGAGVFLVAGLIAVSFIGGWARWNYNGYERKEAWPEYQSLMQTIDELPPGRVHWEANKDLNRYGTPMSLMLIDYWSEGHPSQEGLFFESSLTTPFHFLNAAEMSLKPSNPIPGLQYHTFDFDRGIPHLGLYGVRYYISFTEEAAEEARAQPDLTEIAASDPFVIFELPPSSLVDVATYVPAVYHAPSQTPIVSILNFGDRRDDEVEAGQLSFDEFALEWYDNVDNLQQWVVDAGPSSWPRVTSPAELPFVPVAVDGQVSNVEMTDDRITFKTSAVGAPHLVKMSYFPNWTANGADGPYRAAPSLMVVVPTQEDVELRFGPTWVEWVGRSLTLLGLLALPLLVLARRRKLVS